MCRGTDLTSRDPRRRNVSPFSVDVAERAHHTRHLIHEMLSLIPFLEAEMIGILLQIQDCRYLAEITTLEALGSWSVSNEYLAEPLRRYGALAMSLDQFVEAHLRQYEQSRV